MPLPKANATKITVEVDSIFSSGHSDFLATNFLEYQEEYERLVHEGQTPKALFISCSDSRVQKLFLTHERSFLI
jgi:carbonic anhydrase